MRRPRSKLKVDTFPFLAVLLCAMGSLILVLLVMDRRAKLAARQKVEQLAARQAEEAAAITEKLRAEHERRRQEKQAEWERKRDALHARLTADQAALQERIRQVREQLAEASARLRAEGDQATASIRQIEMERGKLAGAEQALRAQRAALGQSAADTAAANTFLARMTEDLLQAERTLRELRAARERERQTYSVVPYRGKQGDSRRPLYIECAASGLIFHPDRVEVDPGVYPSEARREVERRVARQRERLLDAGFSPEATPYLLLLVRPQGVTHYYEFQSALRGMPVDFGYELVDADWVLDFPEDDRTPAATWANRAASTPSATPSGGPTPSTRIVGIPSSRGASFAGDNRGTRGRPGDGGGLTNGEGGSRPGGMPGFGPLQPQLPLGGTINNGAGVVTDPGGVPGSSGSARARGLFPSGFTQSGTGIGVPAGTSTGNGSGSRSGGNSFGSPGSGAVGGDPHAAGAGTGIGFASGGGRGNGFGSRGIGPFPSTDARGSGGSAGRAGDGSGGGRGDGEATGGLAARSSTGTFASGSGNGSGREGSGGGGDGPPGVIQQPPGPITAGPRTGTTGGMSSGDARGAGAGGAPRPVTIASTRGAVPARSDNVGGAQGSPGANDGRPEPASQSRGTGVGRGSAAGDSAADASDAQDGSVNTSAQDVNRDRPRSESRDEGPRPRRKPNPLAVGGSGGVEPDDESPLPFAPLADLPGVKRPAPPLKPARLRGDRDWVLFLECKPDRIILYPSRQVVPVSALRRDGGENELQAAVRAAIARKQATVRAGDPPYRPIVRFLMRPDSLRTFHLAYPLLDSLAVPKQRRNLEPEDDVASIIAGW